MPIKLPCSEDEPMARSGLSAAACWDSQIKAPLLRQEFFFFFFFFKYFQMILDIFCVTTLYFGIVDLLGLRICGIKLLVW